MNDQAPAERDIPDLAEPLLHLNVIFHEGAQVVLGEEKLLRCFALVDHPGDTLNRLNITNGYIFQTNSLSILGGEASKKCFIIF